VFLCWGGKLYASELGLTESDWTGNNRLSLARLKSWVTWNGNFYFKKMASMKECVSETVYYLNWALGCDLPTYYFSSGIITWVWILSVKCRQFSSDCIDFQWAVLEITFFCCMFLCDIDCLFVQNIKSLFSRVTFFLPPLLLSVYSLFCLKS